MKKNKYDYDKDYNEEYDENVTSENNTNTDNINNIKNFLSNYKTDKKYKSKVQLMGYLIFIIILIIYLNVSNMGTNYNYDSSNTTNNQETNGNTTNENNEEAPLLKRLNNNYTYNVDISLKRTKEDNTEEDITINYSGKSDNENMIINRISNNNTSTFYKAGDEYYKKNNEEYEIMAENEIYDIINAKYIEYASLKKYIEKANLDHYTNYSTGKIEYVYNLNISDIIKSYTKKDIIPINIVSENDTIIIDIDYTNLFKVLNNKITACKINYKYSDIEKTEKIIIFPEDNNTTNNLDTKNN